MRNPTPSPKSTTKATDAAREPAGSRDYTAQEARWRPFWEAIDLYTTGNAPDRPFTYVLDYFPYPSGHGLSVGHCRNYVPTCIYSRFLRMNGHNVLHPMGWDAFGLPAENYAIRHGVHPRETTARQAANYRRQLRLIECSYDWAREINSSDPDYYRWTQWIFLLLYRRDLAYRAPGTQWWCPSCQTILANEQVESGRCWRCDSEVTKKRLQQWYFRITEYADELLEGLEAIDWPESIVAMQRHWIGRSQGMEISFPVAEPAVFPSPITIFTTRPDTIYGATFLALAPEHDAVPALTTAAQRDAVQAYVMATERVSEIERASAARERRGVFTGAHALHPLTGEKIPIYVVDYVLPDYGGGAVMGVPAHDGRDYAFARSHSLPVVRVIVAEDDNIEETPYTGAGKLVHSGPYSGMNTPEAAAALVAAAEKAGWGRARVTYRMREWLISRQRYWGAPIPIIHCPACGTVPVPEEALPVKLPEIERFEPAGDGRSPLARVRHWVETECPSCGGPAERETDTMDGFACSSWYFLRFASPHEEERAFDPAAVTRWLPVDEYVGGAEHAVLHLLYARFWTRVLHDAGLIPFREPFRRLRNQGVLHAPDGRRMSKSRGNVITPEEVADRYGSDVLRTYVVFIGPFEADVLWNEEGISGVVRFLDRYWSMVTTDRRPPTAAVDTEAFVRRMHEVIQKVTEDIRAFKFNTAVAALMGWLNDLQQAESVSDGIWRRAVESFTILLAPFAPFVTESVWRGVLGNRESVHQQQWPAADPNLLHSPTVMVAVQVNGKTRAVIEVDRELDEDALRSAALADPGVQRHLRREAVRRVVVVPQKVINFVT